MTAPGLLITVELQGKPDERHRYVRAYGECMPEIQGWRWPS
ncbi:MULTISPECIES: hypothetical protein [Ensifer]|nr:MULTISPECIES: hypothetical protein [Ensifer]